MTGIDLTVAALLTPLVLGAGLGWLGGLLGIGGGIIAIPILVMFFGMSQQMAQGTALVMITPNVLMAFWRYHQRQPMPFAKIGWMMLLALPSSWAAAHLAVHLDSHILTKIFSVFLVVLSGYFLWSSRGRAPTADSTQTWDLRWLPGIGLVSGFFSGLFTVGAGIVAAPILVRGFGKPMAEAQGIALSLVVPGAVVSLATFAHAEQVHWQTGLLLAVGGVVTVSSGVALAHRLPETKLKRLFAWMLLFTAALMIRSSLP